MEVLKTREIELFVAGIKPGLLIKHETAEEHNLIGTSYYSRNHGKSILLTHSPLPEGERLTTLQIGTLLGYYPKSCEEFWNNDLRGEMLYFGGIYFNTKGYTEDALAWCMERYADPILKLYGKINYNVRLMVNLNEWETIKKGTIIKKGVVK